MFPNPVYCHPNGAKGNDGTYASPLPLWWVAGNPGLMHPAQTIMLRGGTYRGKFVFTPDGLTIRSAPGEWAVLDSDQLHGVTFTSSGANLVLRDVELRNSNGLHHRAWPYSPNVAGCQFRGDAVDCDGPNASIINCLVFDGLNGMSLFADVDGLAYGNIVDGNGYTGSDRTHGHSVYSQNNPGVPRKVIEQNVFAHPWSMGLGLKGDSAYVVGYMARNNTIIQPSAIAGSAQGWCFDIYSNTHPGADIHLIGNRAYCLPMGTEAGGTFVESPPNGQPWTDIEIADCWGVGFAGNYLGTAIEWNRTPIINVMTGNTIHAVSTAGFVAEPNNSRWDQVPPTTRVYHGNSYYGGNATPFQGPAGTFHTLAEWQAYTGQDLDATITAGLPPARTWVDVNDYEDGRALLTVWNPTSATTVNVDASAAIGAGQAWHLFNALNPRAGAIASGTGPTVTCPMTVAAAGPCRTPAALDAPPASTLPMFGVFVVRATPEWSAPPL